MNDKLHLSRLVILFIKINEPWNATNQPILTFYMEPWSGGWEANSIAVLYINNIYLPSNSNLLVNIRAYQMGFARYFIYLLRMDGIERRHRAIVN